jgi:hypothetical protein
MANSGIIYDERKINGDIYGWRVYKNDLGEVRATRQSPISSTQIPWTSDINKLRKSVPKKIKVIFERELTN